MVFGFEHDYKDGAEATINWNAPVQTLGPFSSPNVAPASKDIHEEVDIFKFDLDHEAGGVAIEDRFRGEFYNLNTRSTNSDARGDALENAQEGSSYFQGANTLRLEKKFTDWFFASAGYLYSKLNSSGSFTDAENNRIPSVTDVVPQITLEMQSHVFNINGRLGPFHGLTLSTGVRTNGPASTASAAPATCSIRFTPMAQAHPPAIRSVPATLFSDYDQNTVTESMGLRYSRIPYTALFADARFQQQTISQSDDDLQAAPGNSFIQNTAFTSQMTDFRLGFNTSPWPGASLSAHYCRYENDSQYDNSANTPPPAGYPGFIKERDLLTDEAEARLVLRPVSWLKTSLSYQYLTTDYRTDTYPSRNITPGGDVLGGRYVSQVYSVNATVTPRGGFSLSTTFSWQPTAATSATDGLGSVAPYRGDIYSLIAGGTYALGTNTDLFANYSFSEADYGQSNLAAGLPLGIEYQQHALGVGLARRFGKNVTARLQYGYYRYAEPTSGGAANYSATAIFAALTFRGP